jgi:hypothetical protein
VLQRGLDSVAAAVRVACARAAGLGNHPALVPTLARLALEDKDRDVREQALAALTTQARWRDLAALDGLIAVLDRAAGSPSDRLLAAQGIDAALTPLKRGGLAVDYPAKPVNLEESAGLWALHRQVGDKVLGKTVVGILHSWGITGEDATSLASALAGRVGDSYRNRPAQAAP